MRRFMIVVFLTSLIGTVAFGGAVASAMPARAASTVPVVVIHSKHGGTAVFAKVIIHGRAFAFLIDTGASVTLVNPKLARELHLRTVGRRHTFCGVTGCASARRVRLSNWSIGGQPLPSVVASSAPIAGAGHFAFGLLGSDVLSRFGAVTIDYHNKQLTLG